MLGRLVRNRWLAAGVVVVLVAALASELVALTRDRGVPHAPDRSRDVAREFAVAVTSFDHKRIDQDLARVLSFGSSGFEREFRAAMGANFVDAIKTNKRVSTGEVVLGPTVQATHDGRADFVVVVSQRIVSEGSDTAPQQLRVAMLLTVTTGSRPKVEHVEVL